MGTTNFGTTRGYSGHMHVKARALYYYHLCPTVVWVWVWELIY